MCSPATCRVCKRTTWSGCGQHINQVRRSVPASDWCGGEHSAAEIAEWRANRGGFFSRLFGR